MLEFTGGQQICGRKQTRTRNRSGFISKAKKGKQKGGTFGQILLGQAMDSSYPTHSRKILPESPKCGATWVAPSTVLPKLVCRHPLLNTLAVLFSYLFPPPIFISLFLQGYQGRVHDSFPHIKATWGWERESDWSKVTWETFRLSRNLNLRSSRSNPWTTTPFLIPDWQIYQSVCLFLSAWLSVPHPGWWASFLPHYVLLWLLLLAPLLISLVSLCSPIQHGICPTSPPGSIHDHIGSFRITSLHWDARHQYPLAWFCTHSFAVRPVYSSSSCLIPCCVKKGAQWRGLSVSLCPCQLCWFGLLQIINTYNGHNSQKERNCCSISFAPASSCSPFSHPRLSVPAVLGAPWASPPYQQSGC